MSDSRGKVSAAPVASNSSRQPVLTYAETAKKHSKPTLSAGAAPPAPATSAPATTVPTVEEHYPPLNSANGPGDSRSIVWGAPAAGFKPCGEVKSDAAVRLPLRNSVPLVTMPAIQFGSLSKQGRPSSPLADECAAPTAAVVTSGGVPAASIKLASSPSFGSTQSSTADSRFAAPYMPQTGVYNAPHHMGGQPISQPMGYGAPPTTGWVAPLPHQYAYMHMGDPGYEQYYPAPSGAGDYGLPSSTLDMAPLTDAPGMAASPVGGQHSIGANSGLRVNAQVFIPGRRPVRIVNPDTNEEIDLSKQHLRSVSSVTSASGSAVESVLAGTADVPVAVEEKLALPKNDVASESSLAPSICSDAEAAVTEVALTTAATVEAMIKEAVSEPISSVCDKEKPVPPSVEEEQAGDGESEHKSDPLDLPPGSPDTRRTLTPAEILELYLGDTDVPALVGDILRYPRVFLERFNGLCEPPLQFDSKLVDTDGHWSEDRSSGMRRSTSGTEFGGMGDLRHKRIPNSLASSDERFWQSTSRMHNSKDGEHGSRIGSRSSSGQFRSSGGRTNSTRGGREVSSGKSRIGSRAGSQHGRENVDMANVKPLEKSENRYIAKALRVGKDAVEDDMDEEVFDRRMRVLLNKLTLDNFDIVSDELLAWGNKSINETNARMLRHLVMLVYQKAIDEPNWASMYARLCHRIICNVDMQIEDHNLLTKDGKYLCGGFIVRKYLLTKCQEDFERGWKVEIPQDMESEEYYNAVLVKRQGLGLVRLVGELFLLDILKPPILHECVKRLLSNFETPEEEETVSVAMLLTTAGKKLDVSEDKDRMDAYFARVQAMSVNSSLLKRIRFTLLDVIDLRKNGWVPRVADVGPKTIAEIHKEAERKKQAEDTMYPTSPHLGRRSETSSRRGRTAIDRSSGSGRSGYGQHVSDMAGLGSLSRSRQQRGSSTLVSGANTFGTIAGGSCGWSSSSLDNLGSKNDDSSQSLALGPGRRVSSNSSLTSSAISTPRSVSTRNMFDLLMSEDDDESLDLSPVETATSLSRTDEPTMDTETMKRKIKNMIDEYMSLKDDAEFVECFKELGEVNFQMAVFEIANNVMDRRPAHAEQVAKAIGALRAGNVLSEDVAAAGLAEFSEMLEDIVIDAPNAYKFFGMLVDAAQVPRSRVVDEVLCRID
ncbi:hypothetical protein IW152_000177 [Coemansia sp. BCRC 34962]|nr:hypothetical protein IW152_000177 [Coemansia sp. BCRC 34962]